MRFSLTTVDMDDHLHIRLTGTWDSQTSELIVRSICETVLRSPHVTLLLDTCGIEVQTSVVDGHAQASLMAILLADRQCRVAILHDRPHLEALHDLWNLTARRHDVDLKFFEQENPALEWLREALAPAQPHLNASAA